MYANTTYTHNICGHGFVEKRLSSTTRCASTFIVYPPPAICRLECIFEFKSECAGARAFGDDAIRASDAAAADDDDKICPANNIASHHIPVRACPVAGGKVDWSSADAESATRE